MNPFRRQSLLASACFLLFCSLVFHACTSSGDQQRSFVAIGTGAVTGVYYPTGQALAQMINQKEAEYGVRASVESTGGSVFNVNAIVSGDLDFGVVQSDRQYQAYHGLREWETAGPQESLRSLFSLHAESVTLVASVESGINSLEQIKGKRVNIGNPGSGQRGNSLDVLRAANINHEADFQAESLTASEAPNMLQDGRLDAFFYTVGHPSGAITEASSGNRKVRIIPIVNMEALLASAPYYAPATINHELYPGLENEAPIPSIGVKATFVTDARVSDEIVYALTKEVFENLEQFKSLHPAFAELTPADMLQALSAPVHPGALRYYVEADLIHKLPENLRPVTN